MGLHSLTHEEDEKQEVYCTICENAIVLNQIPVLTPNVPTVSFTSIELYLQQEPKTYYRFIGSNTIATNQLFYRPPPRLL